MKYLIIGPGGLGFFGMLGCLTNLKEELKNVEEISGSSAGSLLGFLLLTNKSLEEIFDISLNINISELTKMNLNAFIKTFGFIDHELIKQKLIEIWGGNPRFKDLSKKFHVSAYCLNTLEVEYFSIDTNPDMYVIDAICASISVPFMFAAFNFNGKLYIDGGANEKIPALPFLNKKREDVLCVATRTFKSEHVEINSLHSFRCTKYCEERHRFLCISNRKLKL